MNKEAILEKAIQCAEWQLRNQITDRLDANRGRFLRSYDKISQSYSYTGIFALVLILCLSTAVADGSRSESKGRNLAVGKPYRILPTPNYGLTKKGDTDDKDLTDGKVSGRDKIWFEPRAVGVTRHCNALIQLDLGESQPIDEVNIRLQGGVGNNPHVFPDVVELLVSDDGETFYLVDDFSFWRLGDRRRFNVPREQGTPWVYKLRFENLRTRARYVGLRIRGGNIFSDEIEVLQGSHDPAAVKFQPESKRLFTVSLPYVYSQRPTVHVCRDFAAPSAFGVILPSPEPVKFAFHVDLPRGVHLLEAGQSAFGGLHGSSPSVYVKDAEKITLTDGGTRYVFRTSLSGKSPLINYSFNHGRTFARLMLQTDWPAGKTGTLRFGMDFEGGGGYEQSVPLEAVSVGPTPRSERLLTLMGPFNPTLTLKTWPNGLDMCERVGFTAVPAILRDARNPKALEFLDQARARGFKVAAFTSAMNYIYHRWDETNCQIKPGVYAKKHNSVCPLYRGKHFQDVLKKVVSDTIKMQPDFETWDIEFYNWKGPSDVQKCVVCRADFEKSGLKTWEEWKSLKSVEYIGVFYDAVAKACKQAGVKMPSIGVYDFVLGTHYQRFWDVSRLHARYGINTEPSTYSPLHPSNLEHIGDEVRQTRLQLGLRGRVIPWLTPGDWGLYSSEQFTWALLECFANGAEGVYFWSHRHWDVENLIGYSRALKIVYPVQAVIAEGKPLSGVGGANDVRVRGMTRGNETFFIVADYRIKAEKTVRLTVPVTVSSEVVDLATGQSVGRIDDERNILPVTLTPQQRQQAFYVRPVEKSD